jgi:hypothetical protein
VQPQCKSDQADRTLRVTGLPERLARREGRRILDVIHVQPVQPVYIQLTERLQMAAHGPGLLVKLTEDRLFSALEVERRWNACRKAIQETGLRSLGLRAIASASLAGVSASLRDVRMP